MKWNERRIYEVWNDGTFVYPKDIEMNPKNRNCGVRITIHQRFLFVQLQQCVIAVYKQ